MGDTWNCCRTCLNTQPLHPIFALPEHSDKYSDVILSTTGVKVDINDTLPHDICSECIKFINESLRFRKHCKHAQKSLEDYKLYSIKLEHIHNQNVECDKTNVIDISELLPPEDDYKDYDDNADTFNCEDKIETFEKEYETKVDNVTEDPAGVTITNKRTRNVKIKTRKAAERKDESKGKGSKSETVKQEIECEFCHKILTSKLSLRNHYKIHTGFDVVCEHCGKKFITRRLLLMHCRAKHGYEKTDKCSFCDYKASNAEQVKIHERLHTGEKPFVCGECGAGFHRRSSYLQHIAIHLPEKTVQCSQCPARFKSATLMRIHAHRHRPPRHAYRCALCGGQFARRRNAARHLQRVHAAHAAAHGSQRDHIQRHELP